jgi:hypothetical protein
MFCFWNAGFSDCTLGLLHCKLFSLAFLQMFSFAQNLRFYVSQVAFGLLSLPVGQAAGVANSRSSGASGPDGTAVSTLFVRFGDNSRLCCDMDCEQSIAGLVAVHQESLTLGIWVVLDPAQLRDEQIAVVR